MAVVLTKGTVVWAGRRTRRCGATCLARGCIKLRPEHVTQAWRGVSGVTLVFRDLFDPPCDAVVMSVVCY